MTPVATADSASLSVSNQPLSPEELRKTNAYWRSSADSIARTWFTSAVFRFVSEVLPRTIFQRVPSARTSSAVTRPVSQPLGFFSGEY
jgi:hypothetical protein